jgi:hypothetical protein
MASLSHPFVGRDIGQLMERILGGRYKPLDLRCFSADFRGLVDRLLAVEPADRPDVSEVIQLRIVQKQARTKAAIAPHPLRDTIPAPAAASHARLRMRLHLVF